MSQVPTALTNALGDLQLHGAQGLPPVDEVMQAPNGGSWSGWRKNNQDRWFLVKHGPESYNAEF